MIRNWSYQAMSIIGQRTTETIAILVLVAVMSACIQQRRTRKASDDLNACKANLRNIATACEIYSTDNCGRYPHSLDQLVPQYLTTPPQCPASCGQDYNYQFNSGPVAKTSYGYVYSTRPDDFTLNCQARYHPTAPPEPNFPNYRPTCAGCLAR